MLKQYFLVEQLASHSYLVASAQRRGKGWQCQPPQLTRQLPSTIGSSLYLSIRSAKDLVLIDEFSLLGKELMALQINKRLDQLALLDAGTKGAVCYAPIEQRVNRHLLSCLVLPEHEVEQCIEAAINTRKATIHTCTATAASVAALMQLFTAAPLVTILLHEEGATLIAVRQGLPIYQQGIKFSTQNGPDISMISHAINYCRMSLRRDFAIEDAPLICCGEGYQQLTEEVLGEPLLQPELPPQLSVDREAVMCYPALYGTLFVNRTFCFLPADYHKSVRLRQVTNYLVAGAACGSILLAALTLQQRASNNQLLSQLIPANDQLNYNISTLEQQLPAAETVQQQEKYLQLLDTIAKEPDLPEILSAIARQLPEHCYIESLQVERKAVKTKEQQPATPPTGQEPPADNLGKVIAPVTTGDTSLPASPAATGTGTPAGAEMELQKTPVLLLAISSEGGFENVRSRFTTAVRQLSSLFQLEQIRWQFHENKATGTLTCALNLPTGTQR